jgi:exopolysaccharide biosynthesis WecB/TagA/CpsF family protein
MLVSDVRPTRVEQNDVLYRRIGNVSISSVSVDEALLLVTRNIQAEDHLKLAFANSHVVNVATENADFARALQQFLILPDGVGVNLGSRLLHGVPFPANLNGTDFIPRLMGDTQMSLKVGLVGARPGVAERALQRLAVLAPQHRYRVFHHGFFTDEQEPAILASIAADRPDLLLVAFGNPRQELWIAKKIGREHALIAAGVGALFDFLAGEVARAPLWVRQLRLEWVFRLGQEPIRLWRRYVFGNPVFLFRILHQKWRRLPLRFLS